VAITRRGPPTPSDQVGKGSWVWIRTPISMLRRRSTKWVGGSASESGAAQGARRDNNLPVARRVEVRQGHEIGSGPALRNQPGQGSTALRAYGLSLDQADHLTEDQI
jgi:hypothetical protein